MYWIWNTGFNFRVVSNSLVLIWFPYYIIRNGFITWFRRASIKHSLICVFPYYFPCFFVLKNFNLYFFPTLKSPNTKKFLFIVKVKIDGVFLFITCINTVTLENDIVGQDRLYDTLQHIEDKKYDFQKLVDAIVNMDWPVWTF